MSDTIASPADPRGSQQMARVNVDFETWAEFRAAAIRRRQSVASYLGDLVVREVKRAHRTQLTGTAVPVHAPQPLDRNSFDAGLPDAGPGSPSGAR
jgi:hypothetical protein